MLYSVFTKKRVNFFFLLILEQFRFPITGLVKVKYSLIFNLKIPSKVIFNLILIEMLNTIKGLKIIKSFNFYGFYKKQTKYSVLRSPFVYKSSQEQLLFNNYIGNFETHFYTTNFVVSDFIEMSIFYSLESLLQLNMKVIKKINKIA